MNSKDKPDLRMFMGDDVQEMEIAPKPTIREMTQIELAVAARQVADQLASADDNMRNAVLANLDKQGAPEGFADVVRSMLKPPAQYYYITYAKQYGGSNFKVDTRDARMSMDLLSPPLTVFKKNFTKPETAMLLSIMPISVSEFEQLDGLVCDTFTQEA